MTNAFARLSSKRRKLIRSSRAMVDAHAQPFSLDLALAWTEAMVTIIELLLTVFSFYLLVARTAPWAFSPLSEADARSPLLLRGSWLDRFCGRGFLWSSPSVTPLPSATASCKLRLLCAPQRCTPSLRSHCPWRQFFFTAVVFSLDISVMVSSDFARP